jgi:predicted dehydrogenase
LEQTRATVDAVAEARVPLQVAFMRRFDPAFRQAKDAIQAGRIGQPVTFKAVNRDPVCPRPEFADPAHSGGLVIDMGIHDFDVARWLMSSEVESVSAEGSLLACPDLATVGDIDNAIVNLRFSNGALGNLELSRNARYGFDVRTEVLGTDGAVIAGDFPVSGADIGAARLLSSVPAGGPDETPHFVRRFALAYRAQIEDFVDALQQQRTPSIGGAEALAAFEIAHAATLSWQQQRPVALTEMRAAGG